MLPIIALFFRDIWSDEYMKRFDSRWYAPGVFYRIEILEGRSCSFGREVAVGKLELLVFVIKELFRKTN